MERIKKEEPLKPSAKIHIIYGSIIIFMSIAFTVTLLTMQSSYKSVGGGMPEGSTSMGGEMPPAMGTGGMPAGGSGGMPPFVKQMVQKYKSALEKNPKDVEALTGLANMYYDSGQYPKAITYYEKIVTIEPKNSNVQSDLGTSYFYTKNYEKAIEHFNKAIEVDKKNLNARYNLGVAYKDQGKKDLAKKTWEEMKGFLTTDEEKKRLEASISALDK